METNNTENNILYLSNQVFESIQTPTLESDPPVRSTILYANQYSGIDPVDIEDEELLSILNGSIGVSGNNVLVQLANKMKAFRDGPWYIDSHNGVIHIHNKKTDKDSVYSYTYASENGEVLSVSFRLLEIFTPLKVLNHFVDALDKTLTGVSATMGNYTRALNNTISSLGREFSERPYGVGSDALLAVYNKFDPKKAREFSRQKAEQDYQNILNLNFPDVSPQYVAMAKNWFINQYGTFDGYGDKVQRGEIIHAKAKEFQKKDDTIYNSSTWGMRKFQVMSAPEKKAFWKGVNKEIGINAKNYERSQNFIEVFDKYPELTNLYKVYVENLMKYGNDSVSQVSEEALLNYSKQVKYQAKSNPDWFEFNVQLNVSTPHKYLPGDRFTEAEHNAAIQKTINDYIKNYRKTNKYILEYNTRYEIIGSWRHHNNYQSSGSHGAETKRNIWDTCKIRLYYFAYKGVSNTFDASNWMRGLINRTKDKILNKRSNNPIGIGGNLPAVNLKPSINTMKNAVSNMGKRKVEKSLQATLKVVGNPILEIGQQLDIQNVGLKYSGLWYIHQIEHLLEFGMGYITTITLARKYPKAESAVGKTSEIHTQKYTVEGDIATPESSIGKKKKFRPKVKTTSRDLGSDNVRDTNREHLSQNSIDVPFIISDSGLDDSTSYIKKSEYEEIYEGENPAKSKSLTSTDQGLGSVDNNIYSIYDLFEETKNIKNLNT